MAKNDFKAKQLKSKIEREDARMIELDKAYQTGDTKLFVTVHDKPATWAVFGVAGVLSIIACALAFMSAADVMDYAFAGIAMLGAIVWFGCAKMVCDARQSFDIDIPAKNPVSVAMVVNCVCAVIGLVLLFMNGWVLSGVLYLIAGIFGVACGYILPFMLHKKVAAARQQMVSEYVMLEREKAMDEAMLGLEELIGLESVKTAINRIKTTLEFDIQRGESGGTRRLHMVFLGNPGTGKTEVARRVAKIFFGMGLLPTDNCVDVSRSDLVGEHIGETAVKTREVIDRARGGVLFVDEAYELANKGENDFGPEAIAEIMKMMEDHSDELAVIFAGYDEDMQAFLDANPGIRSRIPPAHYIHFEDYDTEELFDILLFNLQKNGLVLERAAYDDAKKVIDKRRNANPVAFGNARGIRNLSDDIKAAQAEVWSSGSHSGSMSHVGRDAIALLLK